VGRLVRLGEPRVGGWVVVRREGSETPEEVGERWGGDIDGIGGVDAARDQKLMA
jgi:hypothetical protein